MRQATSFGARAAGRRRTRGASSASRTPHGEPPARAVLRARQGKGAGDVEASPRFAAPIPKGRPPWSASDVLRRWGVKRRGGAFTRQAWARGRLGEGSMKDHTLTRSRGCGGWAQVGA